MAKVAADLPRPAQITTVDSKDLLGDHVLQVDGQTGLPKELRAFVVVKDPRMTVVPQFFSPQECDHLLQLVEDSWMPSLVGQATYSTEDEYSKGNLENTLSTTRTSWSCMMRYAQTSVVERLEHRLSKLAGLPLENLERMNMVRYAPGELFDEHHDGKFRPATIFVYLNELPDDEEHGDTYFPVLGVSFRPRRGTAVMWSNIVNDVEDSRMLHAGRAPSKGVKYGVNCFFNVNEMRQVVQTPHDIPTEEAAVVHLGDLVKGGSSGERKLVAYRLCPDPKVVAVPDLLTHAEVDELLGVAGAPGPAPGGPYAAGTLTVRVLSPGDAPLVDTVERRLAATAGLGLAYLGSLRIVRPGTQPGLCNRGCGPKSAYVCLSDEEEVLFTRLGMRLVMRKGDAIMWPNVDWETGQAVEDIRTLRVHLPGETPHLGMDAYFHDNPLREQQRQRTFSPDALPSACPA
mmetsp:Transcript_110485/g.330528  ORF Transcript_110485/g.330528 Transcript_110485/m.330528 type:complete len:458 (+) Transcript_110485:114-1487(+)